MEAGDIRIESACHMHNKLFRGNYHEVIGIKQTKKLLIIASLLLFFHSIWP